jgi:hypothetical protein
MKSPAIPDEIINEIARFARIKDRGQTAAFGRVLRRLVEDVSIWNSGYQKTGSGVTANKLDIKAVEEISDSAAELGRKLKKASPYVRDMLQTALWPRFLEHKIRPSSVVEMEENVAILNDCSRIAHGWISRNTGKHRRHLRASFFHSFKLSVESYGGRLIFSESSGTSDNLSPILQRLRPYLPEEIGNVSRRTIWRDIQAVSKRARKPHRLSWS